MNRSEHLQWCKDRAMEYVDAGRVRMWKVNGVPLPYIRIVSKLGKVAITKLVPTHKESDSVTRNEG